MKLSEIDLERALVEGCSVAKERGRAVRFDGVRLVAGDLSESHVGQLVWMDVECERCQLPLVDWAKGQFTRVAFRDCRATGAKLGDSELVDVRFTQCQMDYASFVGARLSRVTFEQCRLRDADFGQADLRGASFVECDLGGASLVGAELSGADVARSSWDALQVEARDLRGLVVSRDQAAQLALLLGLVVQDH